MIRVSADRHMKLARWHFSCMHWCYKVGSNIWWG